MEISSHLSKTGFLPELFRLSNVIHFIYHPKEKDHHINRILVHMQDRVDVIDLDEVILVMALRGYSEIYTTGGKKYLSAKPLLQYEELLAPIAHFVRANKKYLINVNQVRGYSKGTHCCIYMKGLENEIEVSRRKKKEVVDLLRAV